MERIGRPGASSGTHRAECRERAQLLVLLDTGRRLAAISVYVAEWGENG